MISLSSSIPFPGVHLRHYSERHGEHFICVGGGDIVSDDNQEEQPELEDIKEDHTNGGDSLSAQKGNDVVQEQREEVMSTSLGDQSHGPILIRFVGKDSVMMVN